MKNLYLLMDSDDAEHTYGLFENEADANFVWENAPKDYFSSLMVAKYYSNEESKDGMYYFVIDDDSQEIVQDCFITKEDARKYADDCLIISYEIHGHKINGLYDCLNTSSDKNGEPIKPDNQDDMECSLYDVYQQLKEKNSNIAWFEMETFTDADFDTDDEDIDLPDPRSILAGIDCDEDVEDDE